RLEDVDRALHVGREHRVRVRDPKPVVRRDVEDRFAALDRGRERRRLADIADRGLDIETIEVAAIAARSNERTNALSFSEQRTHDGGADESVRSGHERRHLEPPSLISAGRNTSVDTSTSVIPSV